MAKQELVATIRDRYQQASEKAGGAAEDDNAFTSEVTAPLTVLAAIT